MLAVRPVVTNPLLPQSYTELGSVTWTSGDTSPTRVATNGITIGAHGASNCVLTPTKVPSGLTWNDSVSVPCFMELLQVNIFHLVAVHWPRFSRKTSAPSSGGCGHVGPIEVSHAVATHPAGGHAERIAITVECAPVGFGTPSIVCLLPSKSNRYMPSANADADATAGLVSVTAEPEATAIAAARSIREMAMMSFPVRSARELIVGAEANQRKSRPSRMVGGC